MSSSVQQKSDCLVRHRKNILFVVKILFIVENDQKIKKTSKTCSLLFRFCSDDGSS